MNETHPNWIAEREKCNTKALWKEVQAILDLDVERKNTAEKEKKTGTSYAPFPPDEQSDTQVLIECSNQSGAQFGFCRLVHDVKHEMIVVKIRFPEWMKKRDKTAMLTTRWDDEAMQCRVVVTLTSEESQKQVSEFPHDQLWKAMYVITSPFFFPVPKKSAG